MNRNSIEKSEQTKISIIQQIISIFAGFGLFGLGIYLGLIPLYRIAVSALNGEQIHGNFGVFAFSIPLIPLGIWVLITTFKRQQ